MTQKYATLEDTLPFWFGANDTSGSGDDGATPLCDVRLGGAAAGAAPVLSPTPVLLSNAAYPDGCYEVEVAATAANGFSTGNNYGVFCTLAVSGQNPTGFVGSFTLAPVPASITNQVASASGVLFRPFVGVVETTVGAEVGTEANVAALDGVIHSYEDSGGATEFYYTKTLNANESCASFLWNGYVQSNGDSVIVEGYDWVQAAFVQIGTITGSNGTNIAEHVFDATADMTGTGADLGKVRFQIRSATATLVATDRAWCGFTSVGLLYDGTPSAIHYDNVGGFAGAVVNVNGIPNKRVNNVADMNTLLTGTGFNKVVTSPGSSMTLAASQNGQFFEGVNWTLALGGRDITDSMFHGARVSGTTTGVGTRQMFRFCIMAACTHLKNTRIYESSIRDTQTVGEAGDYFFDRCHSELAGGGATVFDFAAVGATKVSFRHHSGGVEVANMAAGDVMSLEGWGQLIIAASCSGGQINKRGSWEFTDNAGGAVTVVEDANSTSIAAIEADTNELQGDWTDGGRLDLLLDAIPTTAMRGTDNAALASVATEARLAELDAANLPTDIAAIPTTAMRGTDGALTDKAGFSLSATGLDAIAATADGVVAIAKAVWDRVTSAALHNIPGSAGRRLRTLAGSIIRNELAQGSGTGNNQIQFDTGASATDGAYDPAIVSIIAGTGVGQSRLILEYAGAAKTATVDRNWKMNPDATSEFIIVAHPGREHVNEGLVTGAASTTVTLNALASATDNAYVGQTIFIRAGTGEDQARRIDAYDGTTKIATVSKAWDVNPDTTSSYVMLPTALLVNSDLADANWNAAKASHVIPGSFGEEVQDRTGYSLAADFAIKRNTALPNFTFLMVLASDGLTPAPGLTVTATRRLDAGAFDAAANAVSEVGSGYYTIDLDDTDLDAVVATLRFTAPTALDRGITIVTQTE